jgi:hypothetical protein
MPALDQPTLMPRGGALLKAGKEVGEPQPLCAHEVEEAHRVGRFLAAVRRAEQEQGIRRDRRARADHVLPAVEVEGAVDHLSDLLDVIEPGQIAQIERQWQRAGIPGECQARGARAPGRILDAQNQLVVAMTQVAGVDRDLDAELAEVAAAKFRGRSLVPRNPVDALIGDCLDVERSLGAAVQAIRRTPHRRLQAVDLAADGDVAVAMAKALPRAVGQPDGHAPRVPVSAMRRSKAKADRDQGDGFAPITFTIAAARSSCA